MEKKKNWMGCNEGGGWEDAVHKEESEKNRFY